MAEINNNIPNLGHKVEKVNTTGQKPQKKNTEITEDKKSSEYTVDTGVLGRSQVTPKGTDITKSVDETVTLAILHPEIINLCQRLVDKLYQENRENGMSEFDAAINAALAEEELLYILQHRSVQ